MSLNNDRHATVLLIRCSVAIIWLFTGAIVLWIYPIHDSIQLVNRIGLQGDFATAIVYAGAWLDIAMGVLTLLRPHKYLWAFQIAVTLAYSLCIAIFLPEFLIHPFGPVLKNIPFITLLWLLYSYYGSS